MEAGVLLQPPQVGTDQHRLGTGPLQDRAVLRAGLDHERRRRALLGQGVRQTGDVGESGRLAVLVDAVGHRGDVGVEQRVVAEQDEGVRAGVDQAVLGLGGVDLAVPGPHHELPAGDAPEGVDVVRERLDGVDVALEQAGSEGRADVGHHLDGDVVGVMPMSVDCRVTLAHERRCGATSSRPPLPRRSVGAAGVAVDLLELLREHPAATTHAATNTENATDRFTGPPVANC